MEGGKDWWDQIDEALRHVEYMVLVMTPAALASEIVRKEWRLARQRGVCVVPVFGILNLDLSGLPRWMRETHFVDTESQEQWRRLLRTLEGPCRATRVPFMADDLPPDFVPRPKEFEPLVASLLNERKEQPVAITAALKGAGGYGKTTLAQALCHEERIQEEFHDGILWVTLGREPGDVTAKVGDLIEILTGERPGFQNAETAAARLAEALADRDVLLVIDDVWNPVDARPLLRGGSRCVRLLTTRNADTLPAASRNIRVDAMRTDEALRLVAFGLPLAGSGMDKELSELSARLGKWPLLLKLANGVLRKKVHEASQPLADALRSVHRALDQRGVTAFDARRSGDRHRAVSETLGLSFEWLETAEQERFAELAIFPEDTDIPMAVLEKLWQATGGLDDIDVEDLCVRLFDLSLLSSLDLSRRVIRLHDVVRLVQRNRAGKNLGPANVRLLEACAAGPWWTLSPDEQYLWRNLAYHLVEAGRKEELQELLLDYRWLRAKLEAADVNAVLADFDYVADSRHAALVQGAIRLSAHVLAKDRRQLAGQLTGRLLAYQARHRSRTCFKSQWK